MIKILLSTLVILFIYPSYGQTTVSKSWSGSLSIDDRERNAPRVTFSSGTDFPAGSVIESISVSVSFRKVDGSCASPGAGDPFNEEVYFQLRGPNSLPTSNRRLIDYGDFTSSTDGGAVTMTFPGTNSLPAFPTTGSYIPDQALTVYHQESPFGNWRVRGGDDAAQDPLCFTGYTISITANWPLPVEFLSVSLEKKSSTQNKISWSTSSELNADKFILQKSTDGVNWIDLSELKAAGTTNQTNHYSLLDNNAEDVKDEYYRIAQIDFDGTTSFTKILVDEAVENLYVKQGRMNVWGNTGLSSEIMIELSNATLFNGLQVYTPSGKQVLSTSLHFSEKNTVVPLDLSQLETGIYILLATTSTGQKLSHKIVHRQQ